MMFDLHSHILPGIDDGAANLDESLAMARAYVAQGVSVVACTPHILPGVYHNTGPDIRLRVTKLQGELDAQDIPLRLLTGADNHIVPDFIDGLKQGRLLTLGDTSYVLVEPPHHVAPVRLEDLFFSILLAGYIPILTHPERLTWIEGKYAVIENLAARGVWMQITASSLTGSFGSRAKFWAQRMLKQGLVHILATDAHNTRSRTPEFLAGMTAAEQLVGAQEAHHLVVTRPYGIITNAAPDQLPAPVGEV
jgi:protein-tyrosine phosphatase